MQPTEAPETVGAGSGIKGRVRVIDRTDLVAVAAIAGAMVAALWAPVGSDVKVAVLALGIAAVVHIVLTRMLLKDPYAIRFLRLRVAISLAIATVGYYLLHDSLRESVLIYLLVIIMYASRFGAKLGIALGAASSLSVLGVISLRGSSVATDVPSAVMVASMFLFVGATCGMVTAELTKRSREVERLYEELTQKGLELESQASTDHLTGLANRRYFTDVMAKEFHRAQRYQRALALVIVDIDDMKKLNDTYGHQCGDAVIAGVGRLLSQGRRAGDLAARLGGDEFVALLPETDAESAHSVAERMRMTVAEHVIDHLGHRVRTTISVGVGCCPSAQVRTSDDLFRLADQALYEAKRQEKRRRSGDAQLDRAL